VVIILPNGTSSAGKTTLAKALQRRLPDPLLAVAIDTVVFALPDRWLVPPAGPDECAEVVAGAVARHRGPGRLAAAV
jgi:chloramphenicol 3-O-phosphotransferase